MKIREHSFGNFLKSLVFDRMSARLPKKQRRSLQGQLGLFGGISHLKEKAKDNGKTKST